MVKYIKCPRCELNYIDGETQEYCDVCIAEIRGNKLQFADLEDEELDEELDAEATEICPICGVNRMRFGEKMCEACAAKSDYEEEEEIDPDKDEEWKNYLDDDSDDLTVDDEELEEQLKEELDEEEEEFEGPTDDDFFDEDVDSLSDLEDDEYDDDEDDEDDDDLF